ncbi:pilus assembly protein PilM [Chloroflexota bacterium]
MVTLEISSNEIRIMEVEKDRVIRWARQLLEPDVMDGELVVNPQALGAAIRRLMSSSGIKINEVVCSVSGLYSLSRVTLVSVPLGGSVSYQALLDAAYEVMPIVEDEVYLSWQYLGSIEGGQQNLVVSVPRDIIDGEMQALRVAGVSSRVLDLKAMAVIRAVNRKQALIINIESTSYDVILVVDGMAEIMRTNAWDPVELSMEERAEHLALNLELTTGFYNSQHTEYLLDPATPLIITGQMSEDDDLIGLLKNRVNYGIEPIIPPLECPPNLPVPQYAVCIGLALKGTHSAPEDTEQGTYPLPDINLLPERYKPWRPSGRQIYATFAVIAVIALLFPMYQFTSNAMDKTAKLENELSTLNTLLSMRQLELAKREPLQKAIDEYYAILDEDAGVTEDLEFIRNEAKILGVKIEGLVHNISGISFSCITDSYLVFREYKKVLEESGRFTTPITPPEGYPYINSGTILITPLTGQSE